MGLILFLLFLCVPLIEIIGFIQIGSLIGLPATLGIVILTAIAGSILLRHQGLGALFKAQSKLQSGELPLEQMIDGLFLGLAGALLLTPGFFTDIFGFLLFVPPFRRGFASLIYHKVIKPNTTIITDFPPGPETAQQASQAEPPFADAGDGPIIDAEYEEKKTEPHNSSVKEGEISSRSKNPGQKKPGSPWHTKD